MGDQADCQIDEDQSKCDCLSITTEPSPRVPLVVGAAAAKMVGGDAQTGASTAASGTKNNTLGAHWTTVDGVKVLVTGYVTLELGKQVLKDMAGNTIATWVAETKEWVRFNPPATDTSVSLPPTLLKNPWNNPFAGSTGTTLEGQPQTSNSPPPLALDDPDTWTLNLPPTSQLPDNIIPPIIVTQGPENPTSIEKVGDKYLEKNGIDAHQVKRDVVGKNNISQYDIYVDKATRQLWVYRKGGKGEGIPTGEYVK